MTTNKRVRGVVLSSSIAVGVLALLMVGLFAGAAQVEVIAQGSPACEDTTVEFQEVTQDNVNYTWSYTVCQEGFALSHWVLGLCRCFSDTESIVAVGYIDADGNNIELSECNGEDGNPCYELGYDTTTMLFGLKWDNLDGPENECWTFYVTVNQDLTEEELEWASKYAACEPSRGTVTGPACPCDDDCRPVIAFKYYDVDKSGEYDPNGGDYPLSGWQMALISDTDELTSGVTNGDGYVDLGCWPSGTYTVCETLQVGWVNTEPSDPVGLENDPISVCQSVTINGNGPVRFGNYEEEPEEAYILGFKYHDVNGSGSPDDGDHPLNGWEICLDDTENDCKMTEDTAGGSGGFTEYWVVEAGTYTLCETLEDGWVNSDPGGDEPYCKSVTVAAGDFESLEFGNWRYATKSGIKFEDFDGNGVMDGDDIVLPNWTIYLYGTDGAGNSVNEQQLTNENGVYSFTVPPGTYTVCEEIEQGWTQTHPASGDAGVVHCPADYGGGYGYLIELTSGEVEENNDFGNDPREAKLWGCKYHDLNRDRVPQTDEPKLSGWEICLTDVGCKTTGADGCVPEPWIVDADQAYEVCEELQPDWENTDPGDGTLCKMTATLEPGAEETVWFGNFEERMVGGATVAPRTAQTLVFGAGLIALTGVLVSAAGLFVWRRKAAQQ